MSKTLHALMTKLQWQINEILQHVQSLNQSLEQLEKEMQVIQQAIDKAYVIPSVIRPEQEIARLHFIIGQEQQQEKLKGEKNHLISQKNNLENRKNRLNIELKMLERHQEKQSQKKHRDLLTSQQNFSDEWVLQQRTKA